MKGFYNEMSVNEVLNNVNLIGIAGVAGSGKDTFAEIIKKVFESNGFEVNCLSFAKKLKEEVAEVSKNMYGIDTTNCTREEKNLIRPLLLAHGAIMREKTKGQYWIDGIKDLVSNDKINIITDVRFCEYECDEVDWIQSNNGIVVHITRFFEENGERIYISPDNEYEKRNNKITLKQIKYSNKFFEWLVKNYLER